MAHAHGAHRRFAHQRERLRHQLELIEAAAAQLRPQRHGARTQLGVRDSLNRFGLSSDRVNNARQAPLAGLDAPGEVAQLGEQLLELAARRVVALGIAARVEDRGGHTVNCRMKSWRTLR